MLTQNKFSSYLLYAIGEILLVVIGILIALYINNWNQDRLQRAEEIKSLQFLEAEFAGNLKKFDENYAFHRDRMNAFHRILFSDFSRVSLEEIDSLYRLSFYSWTYNPSFSTYNSLVSSGKMNLFSDDSLKIRLAAFKDLVIDYQEDEINLYDYSKEQIFPQEIGQAGMLSETRFNLRKRTSLEALEGKKAYLDYFNTPEYRNKITVAILHLQLILREGEILRKELVDLNRQLEDNISRFER